jgi:hypothetical protein
LAQVKPTRAEYNFDQRYFSSENPNTIVMERNAKGVVLDDPDSMTAHDITAAAQQYDNKLLEGPAGFAYRELKPGSGNVPLPGDVARVSFKLVIPGVTPLRVPIMEFHVGSTEALPGFNLAVMGVESMPPMQVGGTRKVLIPPRFAYGKTGKGCHESKILPGLTECLVQPNAMLEYEIQLLGVNMRGEKPTPAPAPVPAPGGGTMPYQRTELPRDPKVIARNWDPDLPCPPAVRAIGFCEPK